MKAGRLISLSIACVMLATLSVAAGATPQAGPCAPEAAYDPACDVNHDGQINITDIQLTAGHWNQSGMWVGDNNHTHLGQEWTGMDNSFKLQGEFGYPAYAPLVLSNSLAIDGDGLIIASAGGDGVQVNSAGEHGVQVNSAGGHGVYVGWVDGNGVYVNSAYNGLGVGWVDGYGVQVNSAGIHGVYVGSAANNGLFVSQAGGEGVYVAQAGGAGLFVDSAGWDGVYVRSAGNPSTATNSFAFNGFEVAGAEGFGLYVGRADIDGVRIRSASSDGIEFGEGGAYPSYGLYVSHPGTPNITLWPNTSNAAGEWALYTVDNIEAGNVFMNAQTLVAVVGGEQPLATGDVVTAIGLADPIPGSLNHLAQVRLAATDQANVAGVVSSRMALQPAPGKEGEQVMHSTDGPAQPGDYVAITVLGVAQVKVQDGEAIQPGQRLTVSATTGQARALQSKLIEGMMVTEGASVIGVALEAPKDGMVWVLVNPQ